MERIPITTSLSTQQRVGVHTNLNLDSSHKACCYPILTHLFDKSFKKIQNSEKQRKSKKKYVFNIFASFLVFSTSSKKEFKFSKVFGTRSTFHASFLKSLIFLIESTLILLVFKKYKKIKKNQIYKKKES
jgi:hypothetical protein